MDGCSAWRRRHGLFYVQDDGVINIINYLFSLQSISMLPDCMQDILLYA
jgi:hypothetical protein